MASSLKKDTTDSDQTDACQGLSCKLYRALDYVDVSEEMRERHRSTCKAEEILWTTVYNVTLNSALPGFIYGSTLHSVLSGFIYGRTLNRALSVYICGSQYEGTTTRGSDTDMLVCHEDFSVIDNINDIPPGDIVLLMLNEESKPGYVKLQLVPNKTKQINNQIEDDQYITTDKQGRVFFKNTALQLPNTERHGPAYTYPSIGGAGGLDVVYAVRCGTIPRVADEWLRRSRPYQWPSQEQLQRMGSYGCFFVGVAHPESRNKDTEWRISLTLQERDLMSSLNPTQHKCYVFLKMIKKDIIEPRVGKSLSSYHCKTCIFHLAESHNIEKWTPHNLVCRLFECLRLLLDWITNENCPNYFIKEENMFDKLDKLLLKKLSCVFKGLLSKGVCFIYEIKCDGLATRIHASDRALEETTLKVKEYHDNIYLLNIMTNLHPAMKELDDFVHKASASSERLSRANNILQYLENTKITIEHEPTEVQQTLQLLIAYIRRIKAQLTEYKL